MKLSEYITRVGEVLENLPEEYGVRKIPNGNGNIVVLTHNTNKDVVDVALLSAGTRPILLQADKTVKGYFRKYGINPRMV